MTRFDEASASCEIFTFREGVLSAVGHDLKLRAARFAIDVQPDSSVRALFDLSSLAVAAAMRGGREDPRALSSRDRREIEQACANEVLEVQRFPEATFVSSAVRTTGDGWMVHGTLSLHGRTLEGEFEVRREGDRAVARVDLDVRRFGMKQYSAMLGALRVQPRVTVVVSTPVPPPVAPR
jgi:polyisoprenoid-binding protein YceI